MIRQSFSGWTLEFTLTVTLNIMPHLSNKIISGNLIISIRGGGLPTYLYKYQLPCKSSCKHFTNLFWILLVWIHSVLLRTIYSQEFQILARVSSQFKVFLTHVLTVDILFMIKVLASLYFLHQNKILSQRTKWKNSGNC